MKPLGKNQCVKAMLAKFAEEQRKEVTSVRVALPLPFKFTLPWKKL